MSDLNLPLHDDVEIIFSNVSDGSMAAGGGADSSTIHKANAARFLRKHQFNSRRSRILVKYDASRTYTDVVKLSDALASQDVPCDALYTTQPGKVITLPVADCIATVVYDPATNMLGVLHLGRHSSVAGLIENFTIEVADNIGSDPRNWYVWMSPSLQKQHDRLDYFETIDSDEWRDFVQVKDSGIYIDTIGHNRARFIRAGVKPDNIIVSNIDTYGHKSYFSHRAYLDGQTEKNGRMMLAVRLTGK